MAALARREGGLSGDFLGAAIQWSQLWFLLLTV
jgi:adenosylcobinamide-GDP ribazoletransferase